GKPRATWQQSRRAPCPGQTPAAAHPEQGAKSEPGAGSHGGIERGGGAQERGDSPARGAGPERQEQAAAPGGSRADDLAEPALGESLQQAIEPLGVQPWRG